VRSAVFGAERRSLFWRARAFWLLSFRDSHELSSRRIGLIVRGFLLRDVPKPAIGSITKAFRRTCHDSGFPSAIHNNIGENLSNLSIVQCPSLYVCRPAHDVAAESFYARVKRNLQLPPQHRGHHLSSLLLWNLEDRDDFVQQTFGMFETILICDFYNSIS